MPVPDRSLHAAVAVWRAKAQTATDEYARHTAAAAEIARCAYLSGRIDAFDECAEVIGALLDPAART